MLVRVHMDLLDGLSCLAAISLSWLVHVDNLLRDHSWNAPT